MPVRTPFVDPLPLKTNPETDAAADSAWRLGGSDAVFRFLLTCNEELVRCPECENERIAGRRYVYACACCILSRQEQNRFPTPPAAGYLSPEACRSWRDAVNRASQEALLAFFGDLAGSEQFR